MRLTQWKKFEAEEKKKRILARAGGRCRWCGSPAISLAHKIPKTKANIRKYGEEIIHHPMNLDAVCSNLYCNSRSSVGQNRRRERMLVEAIKADIEIEEKCL